MEGMARTRQHTHIIHEGIYIYIHRLFTHLFIVSMIKLFRRSVLIQRSGFRAWQLSPADGLCRLWEDKGETTPKKKQRYPS